MRLTSVARAAATLESARSPNRRAGGRTELAIHSCTCQDARIIPGVASELCARVSNSPLTNSHAPSPSVSIAVEEHMAAVQLQTLHTMTLGQQTKMYNVLPHSPSQNNCVIVSTGIPHSAQMGKSVIQGKRPLAPAPERTSVLVTNSTDLRCKRKISFLPYGNPGTQQPASVARRNARERNRVKQVNNGFATLRQHIPSSVAAALASPGANSGGGGRGASKKLSKVETLRMAVEYIRSLQQMLDDHESDMSSTSAGSDGMVESHYYTSSPESVAQQMSHPILLQQTPPCSEASASPTPSFSSEGSVSVASTYAPTVLHPYSQDSYENYDTASPEDEELLDAIQWWQQQ